MRKRALSLRHPSDMSLYGDIDFLFAPVLEFSKLKGTFSAGGYDAVVITSQNAIHAIDRADLSISILTVGEATERKLNEAGFKNVFSVNSNVEALLLLIYKGEYKRLLYLRGETVATDIKKALAKVGIEVHEKIVYTATPVHKFDNSLMNKVDWILFFSRNGALVFLELADINLTYGKTAICISEKVGNVLERAHFKQILVAKYPNEESMIEEIYSSSM